MSVTQEHIVRTLMRDHARLYAYCLTVTGDEHCAEDILQEVALAAINHSQEIVDEAHLMGWMRRAVRLRSLEHRRKQHGRPVVLDADVLEALEKTWARADECDTSETMDVLRGCVEKLSPTAKRVIELRYGEGMSSSHVARRLGRKVQTIYVTIARAHRALQDCVRYRLGMGGHVQ